MISNRFFFHLNVKKCAKLYENLSMNIHNPFLEIFNITNLLNCFVDRQHCCLNVAFEH
jgi:hypothetical protein